VALLSACDPPESPPSDNEPHDFPVSEGGKTDVFGRALAGVAAPYEPDLGLAANEMRLASEMGYRREVAWQIVSRTLDPVPLLGLAEATDERVMLPDGEVPRVPRFETWYGVDDFKRMFQYLYEGLGEDGRARRAPFSEDDLATIFEWNAAAIERSSRWPLERFIQYVNRLGVCPEGTEEADCARMLQSNFSGGAGGNARITYAPATMLHLLRSYPRILACLDELETLTLDREPSMDNFSFCMEQEFPPDAVLIKAQWVRADFGMQVPTWDTDANAILRALDPATAGEWATPDRMSNPPPSQIYTIRLLNGDTFRLAGLHIMTKELRHWTWITMWWSDTPTEDFGADRPDFIRERLDPVFSNYKMCVVTWYDEQDLDAGRSFEALPTLASALRAAQGPATWCSNPYVEHGRGNARTNCIGCHQHGGSKVFRDGNMDGTLDPFDLELVIRDDGPFPMNGRQQIRQTFPADYLWSFSRVDDLSGVIRSEVEHFDFVDRMSIPSRARRILELTGNADNGRATFETNCTRCHGPDGSGTSSAPSLFERVPMRDDLSILTTIIGGRLPMPAWGDRFDDQTLADLVRFLRTNFDTVTTEAPTSAGDLVITEIMYDPQATDDSVGEWVELMNPTDRTFTLEGCTLSDAAGGTTLGAIMVAPRAHVTLASSASPGFTPTATMTLSLNNTGDTVTLACGSATIDTVDYTSFPRAFGASLSLDPSATSHTANDDGVNWCWGTAAYATDLGSPNAPNPTCM
jgi:mono/diheme cytochrome c family protein